MDAAKGEGRAPSPQRNEAGPTLATTARSERDIDTRRALASVETTAATANSNDGSEAGAVVIGNAQLTGSDTAQAGIIDSVEAQRDVAAGADEDADVKVDINDKETGLMSDNEDSISVTSDFSEDFHTDLSTDLINAIVDIENVPEFAVFGELGEVRPQITVKNVGPLTLPLSPTQVTMLKEQARRVPARDDSNLGSGPPGSSEGHVWELEADDFSFDNPEWDSFIASLCRQVVRDFNIPKSDKMTMFSNFHKLLLCEQGGVLDLDTHPDFDTVFGTLVIDLPSYYEGGKVVMRHGKSELTFDLANIDQSYLCWYSDVAHKVEPVTSGSRLVLTYDLCITGVEPHPSAAVVREQTRNLRHTLSKWAAKDLAAVPGIPPCIFYPLKDAYQGPTLSLEGMKGNDAVIVQTLQQMKEEVPVEVFLAHLQTEERDYDDWEPYHYNSWLPSEEDDGDEDEESMHPPVGEDEEFEFTVTELVDLDGRSVGKDITFSKDKLVLDREDFFEDEVLEKTAVVIMPRSQVLGFLEGSDPVPVLDYLLNQSAQAGSDRSVSDPALRGICQKVMAKNNLAWLNSDLTRKILELILGLGDWAWFNKATAELGGNLDLEFFVWIRNQIACDRIPFEETEAGLYNAAISYTKPSKRCLAIRPLIASPAQESTALELARDEAIRSWVQRVFTSALELAASKHLDTDDGVYLVKLGLVLHGSIDNFKSKIVPLLETSVNQAPFMLGALASINEYIQMGLTRPGSLDADSANELVELWKRLAQKTVEEIEILSIGSLQPSNNHDSEKPRHSLSHLAPYEPYVPPTPVRAIELHFLESFINQLSMHGADKTLFSFVFKVAAKADSISLDELHGYWLPLLECLLRRDIPVSSPRFQHLFGAILESYTQRYVDVMPWPLQSLVIQPIQCSCSTCAMVNIFLADPSRNMERFDIRSQEEQDHLCSQISSRLRLYHTPSDGSTLGLSISKEVALPQDDPSRAWLARRDEAKFKIRSLDQSKLIPLLGEDYHTIVNVEVRPSSMPPAFPEAPMAAPGAWPTQPNMSQMQAQYPQPGFQQPCHQPPAWQQPQGPYPPPPWPSQPPPSAWQQAQLPIQMAQPPQQHHAMNSGIYAPAPVSTTPAHSLPNTHGTPLRSWNAPGPDPCTTARRVSSEVFQPSTSPSSRILAPRSANQMMPPSTRTPKVKTEPRDSPAAARGVKRKVDIIDLTDDD